MTRHAEVETCKEIPNFTGYVGDTLQEDKFNNKQFDCIVANPPFSVKYDEKGLQGDKRFTECGIMPPQSKADWAFMLHILSHLKKDGVAVVLEFPGILYRGAREGKIRKWFVEQNYVDRVVDIPPKQFEDTSIATCIIILRKNRATTSIVFEDVETSREREVSLEEIKSNDYILSVQTYLPIEIKKEHVDIDSVNKQIVDFVLQRVEGILELRQLEEVFGDMGVTYFIEQLKKLLIKYNIKVARE